MSKTQDRPAKVDVAKHGLKQHDIKISTIVFMIFCFVAAGCYGIEEMIPAAGPGLTVIMLCVLPFVWGLPFGLVASELGSLRPQEGGYYKWVQEALGEFWGFQAGWWRTISVYIDNTLYVILAGSYLANQLNMSWTAEFIFKVCMIITFIYINIRGIKDVGSVSTILSILVMLAFALVAVCGFTNWGGAEVFGPLTPEEPEGVSDWFFYVGSAIAVGIWMYSGYESMSTVAGELKDPQVIPKATLITIPLIMATYILPTTAGLGSMGRWDEWGTRATDVGYASVMETFWGPAMGIAFAIVAVIANSSIYNTYITSGSRGFFCLAEDNLAPPILVKCDPKRGVPYIAVLSVGIANLFMCILPFGVIVVIDVFLFISAYILVYISAMILRKRVPKEEYKFRIPGGYGVLCVLCIMPICIALLAFFINGSDYFMGGMVGIFSGPFVYWIWRHMYGGLTKKNPEAFPQNPKTGLAIGDMNRMAIMFCALTIIGVVGIFFLPWYEVGWWSGDYYDGMFESKAAAADEAIAEADGVVIFGVTMTIVKVVTVISAVAAVGCGIIGHAVEPKKGAKKGA